MPPKSNSRNVMGNSINQDMVTFNELTGMAILAFKNALRLHFDSAILLKNKSFASATMLSVLAMEEFGKYFSLSSYVFYKSVNETRDLKFEEEYLKKLYNHPFKQKAFFGQGFESADQSRIQDNERYFENLKQRALYVGYGRDKGKILFDKEVNSPETITNEIATKQVEFLNDLIMDMVNQQQSGIIYMDEDEVNDLFNENLLRKLEACID